MLGIDKLDLENTGNQNWRYEYEDSNIKILKQMSSSNTKIEI